MTYNWQEEKWPDFQYDYQDIELDQVPFLLNAGKLNGMYATLPEEKRKKLLSSILLVETLANASLENQSLKISALRQAIEKGLSLPHQHSQPVPTKLVDGHAAIFLSIRRTWKIPLNETLLFDWYKMLLAGNRFVLAGQWRKKKVKSSLFEGPPPSRLAHEMQQFIRWFNATAPSGARPIANPLIRAALTYLYLESLLPMEDHNGSLARILAEKALHGSLKEKTMLCLSKAIEAEGEKFEKQLNKARKTLKVKNWLQYFAFVIQKAQEIGEKRIQFAIVSYRFLDTFQHKLNKREQQVLLQMIEQPEEFENEISAKHYMGITGTSKATATRDLQELRDLGILLPVGSGRSARYQLHLPSG